jgi:hypothetical protein
MNLIKIRTVLMSAFIACSFSCKTTRQDGASAKNPASVLVNLENLLSRDQNNQNFIYSLSKCGGSEAEVSGELQEPTIVKFKLPQILRGSKCNLKIINGNMRTQELGFKGERSVMYSAEQITIGKNSEGRFIANAFLKREYYYTGQKRFSLVIPFELSQAPRHPKSLSVDIKCVPNLFLSSESIDFKTATSGQIIFHAVINNKNQLKKHQCSQVLVLEAGLTFATADIENSKAFELATGKIIKINETPLKLKVLTRDQQGITVHTSERASECTVDEIFDLATRTCKPI